MVKNTFYYKDKNLTAIFVIVDILRCRSAKIESLKILKDNRILIQGAKKTEDGDRGLDRVVELSERSYQFIASQILIIRKIPDFKIKNYQFKLDYQMKKLFPRRKHRPNLYTFRHMHGTKLKSSDLSKK